MDAVPFRETVAIIGPGLIGGSVALALHRNCPASQLRIAGFHAAEIERARALQLAAVITDDPIDAARGADLVVLCTPPDVMPAIAQRIAPELAAGAVVTDVGSVKRWLVAELNAIFGSRYVGAHPMAGSERGGLEAARADLFEGAICFQIPGANADNNARVRAFWQSLGCEVAECAAAEHDEIVARVSHLPHVVAAALLTGAEHLAGDPLRFSGPGLRDTTRLASGPAELWTGILAHNRDAVGRALCDLRRELERVEALLAAGDDSGLRAFLDRAVHLRDRLPQKSQKSAHDAGGTGDFPRRKSP